MSYHRDRRREWQYLNHSGVTGALCRRRIGSGANPMIASLGAWAAALCVDQRRWFRMRRAQQRGQMVRGLADFRHGRTFPEVSAKQGADGV